eukprot:g3858.t1
MPLEAKEYWTEILESVESPAAKKLISQLDLNDVTGIPKHMSKSPNCLQFHTQIKNQYPEKIVFIQVGEFYESCGLDSVFLVNYCGLNPMNLDGGTPKAGFPLNHLPRILNQLVHHCRLSVVICKELPDTEEQQSKSKQKNREITQIYNPGEQGFDKILQNPEWTEGPGSMIGLFWEAAGFGVMEFRLDKMSIKVIQNLTEDALWGFLSSRTITVPISVHSDFITGLPDWKKFLKKVVPGVSGRHHYLKSKNPVLEFSQFMKSHFGYSQEQEILIEEQDHQNYNHRRNPSYSTASQIGITGLLGIPNILDFLTPKDNPVGIKAWFKDLLLVSKSLQTTAAVQRSLTLLEDLGDSLPSLRTELSPEKVAKALDQKITSVEFCRSLHGLLLDVQSMFNSPSLETLTKAILPIVEEEQNVKIDMQQFHEFCIQYEKRIAEIVVLKTADNLEEQEKTVDPLASAVKLSIQELFKICEDFYGVVHQRHLSSELKELELCKEALINHVFDTLDCIQSLSKDSMMGPPVSVHVDYQNTALYLNCPDSLLKHPEIHKPGLQFYDQRTHAKYKNTKNKKYTTLGIKEILNDYMRTCEEVRTRVQDMLNALGEELKRERKLLIATCQFGLTLQALVQHSFEAQNKGWKLPNITNAVQSDENRKNSTLQVHQMWPYWMQKEANSTVKNSLNLKDMVLLTGPNMGGKSTVMRSLVACALLALSGLYVPAEAMECPYLDSIALRSFSGDNPLAKQSGFSMEMNEMSLILKYSSEHSLILLDELGKGTEVKTGSAIAGSFLEYFAKLNCKGIFSTHLHLMKKMPLVLNNISFMKMDTKQIVEDHGDTNGDSMPIQHVPQWTITHGYNLNTLGIEVARRMGIDNTIINRAYENQQHLLDKYRTRGDSYFEWNEVPKQPIQKTQHPVDDKTSTKNGVLSIDEVEIGDSISPPAATQPIQSDSTDPDDYISQVFQRACQENGMLDPSTTDTVKVRYFQFCAVVSFVRFQIRQVKSGHIPPPITSQRSCVYLCRLPTGYHYVGETDNLRKRLKTHRQRELGREFTTWYICIPKTSGAKSMSRAIERSAIQELTEFGKLMQSTRDSQNQSFGIRE